jgi:hypothetical protein
MGDYTSFMIDTDEREGMTIISVTRDIISEEDDRDYEMRMYEGDYDHQDYPNFNFDDYIDQSIIMGYQGDMPPRITTLLGKETLVLEFRGKVISKVTISSNEGTYELLYRDGIFQDAFLNGQKHEDSILKVTMYSPEFTHRHLHYYGVHLYQNGRLEDEALRMTSDDMILSAGNLPFFIANYKDGKWQNIRPYNSTMANIFTLVYKPFSLQIDIPTVKLAVEIWYTALKELLEYGFNYPYITRIFDGIKVNDNVTEWKGYKMITIYHGDGSYHTFTRNKTVYAMAARSKHSWYLYFIRNGSGYRVSGIDAIAFSQNYKKVLAYTGNTISPDEDFSIVEVNATGCRGVPGLVCTRTSIYDPFWDPFSLMLKKAETY